MRANVGLLIFAAAMVAAVPGCLVASRMELNDTQAQNRALLDQTRAQAAEIENLKNHNRDVENRLIRDEEQLALLQDRAGLDQKQIDGLQREREELYGQFKGLACNGGKMPPELARQFADLSRRYPSLQFDPDTGVTKLDTDILFRTGQTELKPEAEQLVSEFARVLKSPAAADLKIMIVGHTDDRQIAAKPLREKYPNNFHLSAARALAVADCMKRGGLPERQIAVAGFGSQQPAASNATAQDRQKNRRVEIFVTSADAPVVGWMNPPSRLY